MYTHICIPPYANTPWLDWNLVKSCILSDYWHRFVVMLNNVSIGSFHNIRKIMHIKLYIEGERLHLVLWYCPLLTFMRMWESFACFFATEIEIKILPLLYVLFILFLNIYFQLWSIYVGLFVKVGFCIWNCFTQIMSCLSLIVLIDKILFSEGMSGEKYEW